ncbi:MAG: HAD-IIB family hydrolase, partial [Clostridia bacterium]|nr:HAD-IIB family hydrolase [Clostridia bacterium]
LEEKFGDDIWYQPNEIELTAFPKNQDDFDNIESFVKGKNIEDIIIYRQVDCFDIVPSDVSKRKGLEYLGQLLGLDREDFVAVGDGINDYPMFEYAGLSLGVNVKDKSKVDLNFDKVDCAIEYLLK